MTDSVAVFPPGFRLTDTEGVPYAGAVVKFFDAGTSTPKTVYADEDLSVSLGTQVVTDAYGYPTSNGSTRTLIFLGTASYKVTAETSAAVTIWSHDECKGAAAGATSGGGSSGEYLTTVSTKSLDYTVLDADQDTVFLTNCSSTDVVYTLPSAVTVGAGWRCRIEHAGSANQARLESVSSQTIRRGSTSYGEAFAMSYAGEGVTLVSDGGNWVLVEYSPPFPTPGTGVISVADRLSSPPGGPAEGALYLLTSSPSGGWSSFAEHDIAQWTGDAWIKFTPPTDSGWIAYVQDEDLNYQHRASAWALLAPAASTSVAGVAQLADAAAMEAGTSGRVVTADVAHRHPSAAKFWAFVTVSGGTPTLTSSYNVTSITDTATGRLTVTIATDFSSANWCCLVSTQNTSSGVEIYSNISPSSMADGSVEVFAGDQNGSFADPQSWHIVGYGDQA